MVKIRKNRQPRNWQEQTHVRSHGGMLHGRSKFSPYELKIESKYAKLKHNNARLLKQCKNTSDKLAQAHGTPMEAELRYKLSVLETRLWKNSFHLSKIDEQNESYFKGLETRKENLQKEMQARIKNMERAEKFRGNNHKREFVFPNREVMVEHIENRRGKRKLVKKYSIKLADKLEEKRI